MSKVIDYTDFFSLLNPDNINPVAGVFMTYGFDAELFEKHILPDFLCVLGNTAENELRFRNQVALRLKEVPVTVMSDAYQYGGGQTFLYDHILIKDVVFHPKCYLLLFPEYLRIIIGSCNISKSGLCYNAETVWYQDVISGEVFGMAGDMLKWLEWLATSYNLIENDALKEIIKFLRSCERSVAFPRMVTTINERSVFNQFFSYLFMNKVKCKRINIVSPFFESDRERAMEGSLLLDFAKTFFEKYPDAKMRLYFPAIVKETGRGYKVTAPVNILHEVSKEYKNIELYVVNREWVREDGEPVPRTLHAKLIVAELEDNRKMILSGSVNFTSNAMRSNLTSLRNIEVGVVECGKSKFILPPATRTYIEELEYEDKKIANEPKHIFIETVVYDKGSLKILLDAKKAEIPFKIEYQDAVITEVIEQKTEVIINNFKLKRAMDVKFICKTYEFYFPITILNKDDFISDDLKLSFQINMKDIIDYLAGKYKSVSEIERVKKLRLENTTTINAGMSVYFRHNLHRYFKALGALKSGLEEPFYSEAAFKNYLFNPIGLKALINFIVEDYKTGIAAQAETFMFIVEIENVIRHLKFNEDRLEESFKIKLLKEIIEEAVSIRKKIYMKGNNSLKKRYDVLLLEYGLEVR